MNIVVLGNRDPNDADTWSGIPLHLVRSLRERGHQVATIGPLTSPNTRAGRLKLWGYRQLLGKNYIADRDPTVVRARAQRLTELLSQGQALDAVVVWHPTDAVYLRSRAPVIVVHDVTWAQMLDFYPRYGRSRLAGETLAGGDRLDRLAYARCSHVMFSSRWAADAAIHDLEIAPDKITVCPFGANLTAIPDRETVETVVGDRGGGPCRLLFVGVDWERKGGDLAVAVARRLHEMGTSVELMVAGCVPPPGLPDYVRSAGYLSKKDPTQAAALTRLYLEADFLLLPTRADCIPTVLSEAAACGLPVVTTAVGGITELVGDGLWGVALSLDAGPGDYAQWIDATYANRTAYVELATAARDRFERQLNWSVFCRSLEKVIKGLDRHPRRRVEPKLSSSPSSPERLPAGL